MANLSQADVKVLRKLRESEVLQDVNPDLIGLSRGVVVAPCGDGDRFDAFYMWLRGMMIAQGLPPRIHVLSRNGGILVLPSGSPLNTNGRGKDYLEEIESSTVMKGISTLVAYSHAPCGAAGLARIPLLEQFRLQREADAIIQERFLGVQVLCFFHVAWEDGRERIYFFSGEKWRERQDKLSELAR